MAFSPASCQTEQQTGLPVCPVPLSDLEVLHASIAQVVAYMAAHHIPRDEWDGPYVYRDYLSDMVTGNDVAALSRICYAASTQRGIDLPPMLAPLLGAADAQVTADDVYYVAENAGAIGELLGPVLAAMRAVDDAGAKRFPWMWFGVTAFGALLLGITLTRPARKRAEGGR